MFTIFTMTYNDYELTRQFVESIFHHVNPDTYKEILIIDDYSDPNGRLREYEEYLKTLPKIKVINFSEHRRMKYYMDGFENNFVDKEPNLGHGACFNIALQHITTPYVFYVDVDTMFLKSSFRILSDMTKTFERFPNVMAMGQLFGVDDSNQREIRRKFKFFMPQKGRYTGAGGFIGPSAGALRLEGFTKHGLKRFSEAKLPYLFNQYCMYLFKAGFSTYNFPYFTNLLLLHLGKGVVRRYVSEMKRGDTEESWFVFCRDFHKAYGSLKASGILVAHHYGRAFLDVPSKEHKNYMEWIYKAPFDQIQEPLNEELIYTVD